MLGSKIENQLHKKFWTRNKTKLSQIKIRLTLQKKNKKKKKKKKRNKDEKKTVDKKLLKKKKDQKIVTLLKESLRAEEITKQILDLNVNLTVRDLLASALLVEKKVTKASTLDEVAGFCVNALWLKSSNESSFIMQKYFISCFCTNVPLHNANEPTAILNTRAEINIMIKSVINGKEFAIRTGPQLKLV